MKNRPRIASALWQGPVWSALVVIGLFTAVSAQPAPQSDLHFVSIGKVPADLVGALTSHFQRKFGVSIKTLSPMGADTLGYDDERSQMVAEKLIQAIRFRHPTLVKDPRTRIIGITSSDIFMEAMRDKWAFTFSLRSGDRRLAVVSYARMDPVALGARRDDDLMRRRLRKMIAKNIGIMCYGLMPTSNPRSVLFGNVLGVDDLDRMSEEFDPK